MYSHRFVRVLTEKGLRFVVQHSTDENAVLMSRLELKRRGLAANKPLPKPKERDDYERG